MRDWVAWHQAYDDPASALSTRLTLVCQYLAAALDAAPAGPVSLLSLCAGQGHDVLGVLPDHPRRGDVRAVLVEADPAGGLCGRAAGRRPAALRDLRERHRDRHHATVTAAAALVRPGSAVIWTRHRRPPDLTPRIRAWFADAGFAEVAFAGPETATLTGVGMQRLRTAARAPTPPGPLFTFRAAAE
jgi:hypothetical protein